MHCVATLLCVQECLHRVILLEYTHLSARLFLSFFGTDNMKWIIYWLLLVHGIGNCYTLCYRIVSMFRRGYHVRGSAVVFWNVMGTTNYQEIYSGTEGGRYAAFVFLHWGLGVCLLCVIMFAMSERQVHLIWELFW